MTTYFYTLSANEIVEAFESILTYRDLKMYVNDKFNGTYEVEVFYGESNEDMEKVVLIRLNNKRVYEEVIYAYGSHEFSYHLDKYTPDSVYKNGELLEEEISDKISD